MSVHVPLAILVIIIFIIPYASVIYYPYTLYCKGSHVAPWCSYTIPNIYTYIQDKHWEVGFLRSFVPRRAIFIFWGMFGVIIMGIGLKRSLEKWKSIWTSITTPLLIYQLIMFLLFTLIAHINCSSRFLSSTILFYWSLADIL